MVELRRIFLRTVERGATSKSPEWQPFDANDLIRFEFEREGIERYSFIGRWIVGRWVARLKRPPEELSVVVPGMGPAGPLRYKELALWAGYKAGEGLPEDLAAQFGLLEDVLEASGFTVWPMIHGEADDGLATGAVIAAGDDRVDRVLVCSPDKDLAQCVGGKVFQFDRRAGTVRDAAGVDDKFGVAPASIPDWLALVGDTADGSPGLRGWGDEIDRRRVGPLRTPRSDPPGRRRLGRGCARSRETRRTTRRGLGGGDPVPSARDVDDRFGRGDRRRRRLAMGRLLIGSGIASSVLSQPGGTMDASASRTRIEADRLEGRPPHSL